MAKNWAFQKKKLSTYPDGHYVTRGWDQVSEQWDKKQLPEANSKSACLGKVISISSLRVCQNWQNKTLQMQSKSQNTQFLRVH